MTELPAGLQFDIAEPVAAADSEVRCARCGAGLSSYFEVNAAIACAACKDAAVKASTGSHVPTLLRATGLGLLAAALGSAVYYAVARITGYEIGLISIVVGLLVGFGVRKGSRERGGWRYQALAILLTYLAITSTYLPGVFEAMAAQKDEAATAASQMAAVDPETTVPTPPLAAAHEPDAVTEAGPDAAAATESPPDAGDFLLALGMLLAFTLALPFLGGFENAMGLVIIAIALYEAWKVNRIPPLSVTGPYQVGAQEAASDG